MPDKHSEPRSEAPETAAAAARDDQALSARRADMERALRAHRILDTSPVFVVGIDASGRTIFMNTTMLEALGYTRDEVLGREYAPMFVPARDRPPLARIFAELSSRREPVVSENRVLSRSGKELHVEWHGQVMLDEAGAFDYFCGIGIDVTAQRGVRDALFRSQQRVSLHFQQAPVGMIEWDTEFRVVDWNPAAERIFGWSREEALGKHGQELMVPPAVRPYVADIWKQIIGAKGAVQASNENVTKDGRIISCEWSNTALVDADGEVVGVASIVSDVTDRKRGEDALRARERAQAATIEQLSAPVLDVWDGVLAMPVVGIIDEARAGRMMEGLLDAIVTRGARFTILDMTGATAMDAAIARHVGNMVRAAGLIGSECIVSGLNPEMARTLAELDTPLAVRTFGTLRAALRHVIGAARG